MKIINIFPLFNEYIYFIIETIIHSSFYIYFLKILMINLLVLCAVLIKRLQRFINISRYILLKKLLRHNFLLFCLHIFKSNIYYNKYWNPIDILVCCISIGIIYSIHVRIYINLKSYSFFKALIYYIVSFDRSINNRNYLFSHFKRDLIKNATKFIHSVSA